MIRHRARWTRDPAVRKPSEEIRKLLRNKGVLALLAGATAFSGAEAVGKIGDRGGSAAESLTVLEPATAMMVARGTGEVETVADAWLRRATEREARRLASAYAGQGYRVTPELAVDIAEAATKHDIDLEIAFGLVRVESGFRNSATSPVGAVGLTQLMPRTAAWMQPGVSRNELRDPETNLDVGFKYLRYLLDRYDGDENLALLAYNRGPGTVDRALKRGRNPDNGYAKFVRGEKNHGHKLFTRG